jgi:hypothetical protein
VRILLAAVALALVAGVAIMFVPGMRRAEPRLDTEPRRMGVGSGQPIAHPVRQLGTQHPIAVIEIGSRGRWVVACQARVDTDGDGRLEIPTGYGGHGGDDLVPYLFRDGTGEGSPLDGYLDRSSDGRWIVVIRDGKLAVVDEVSGVDQSFLDADVRPDARGYGNVARLHREYSRLLYRRGTDRRTLVIRDLAAQREIVVRTSRAITGYTPERDSPWVALWFRREREGREGTERRFVPYAAREYTCREPAPVGPLTPQESQPHGGWVNVETGELNESPAVLAHLDGQQVFQAADGAVRIGATEIVPAACRAVVRAASAHPLRLVVSCRGAKPDAPLEMFGPDMHAVLSGTKARENEAFDRLVDRALTDESPYVCLEAACFALDDGRRIAVSGRAVLQARGPYILSFDGLVTDGRTGITTPLLPVVSMEPGRGRVEQITFGTDRLGEVARLVVDLSLSPPRAVRELGPADAAADDRGQVLRAPGPAPLHSALLWGPLRWVDRAP